MGSLAEAQERNERMGFRDGYVPMRLEVMNVMVSSSLYL